MWSIRSTRHPVKEREDIKELDNLLPGLLARPCSLKDLISEDSLCTPFQARLGPTLS